MDLTKLLALISTQTLRFTNVIEFEDPYEGYIPIKSVKHIKSQMMFKRPTDKQNTLLALKQRKLYEKLAKQFYGHCFVNCWHKNEDQSAAMWKLYLSANEGVAIQTTLQRLQDSFDCTRHDIQMGEVKYIDFDKLERDRLFFLQEALLMKRRSFKHEEEFRAMFVDYKKQKDKDGEFLAGHDIECHPDVLIEQIYLAPTCPSWIKKIVESVLERYGITNKPVVQSNLYQGPVR